MAEFCRDIRRMGRRTSMRFMEGHGTITWADPGSQTIYISGILDWVNCVFSDGTIWTCVLRKRAKGLTERL